MIKTENEKIYAFLDEIRTLVDQNRNQDGTCRFDALRIEIALDFAKTELKKSIAAYLPMD